MKTCSRCKTPKPLDAFSRRSATSNKPHSWCKACHVAHQRTRRGAGNVKRAYTRDAYLRATYNLSLEDYERLLAAQHGRCAICLTNAAPNNRGVEKPCWHVDHDHTCCPGVKSCGACVRGLLCRKCNTALGHLEGPNAVFLTRAVQYVDAHRKATP